MPDAITSLVVNGTTIEAVEQGSGPADPVPASRHRHRSRGTGAHRLAKGGRVIAPSHPGFGTSQLPKGMTSVDDVSYFYLDLLEQLDLNDVLVVGVGLGGWIAAEIAVKIPTRLSRARHRQRHRRQGRRPRDTRHRRHLVADAGRVQRAGLFRSEAGEHDYKNMPEAESLAAARNREAYARIAWSPYMHNPKLKSRLHRIKLPTLFLWGTADRILSEKYGRGYCGLIAGAQFETDRERRPFPAHRAARRIRPPGARLRRRGSAGRPRARRA